MKTIYMSNAMSYYFIKWVTILRSSIALKAYYFLYKQYFILFQKLAIAPKATKGLTGALLTLHIYKKTADRASTNFGQTPN